MSTEPDTSRPGWKARTIFGMIGIATAISFFSMGSTRTLIAGLALLGLPLHGSDHPPTIAPLAQAGTQTVNDDVHDAWQLHHHGADWDEIGTEIGCSPTTAQTFAAATRSAPTTPQPKSKTRCSDTTPAGPLIA
ncbi:hypothetical protein G9U53_31395 [Rhodococcus sp. D-46]|nr:hypothetical protein [Rhodococcus sp. ADH]NHE68820.1 hypothetical protein [Rhodococcus sp. D-46]